MTGTCECIIEHSGSIKEVTASSFTFSLVSFWLLTLSFLDILWDYYISTEN